MCAYMFVPVLDDNIKHLGDYATTSAIISFPPDKAIPKALVQKLVKASIKEMKQKPNPAHIIQSCGRRTWRSRGKQPGIGEARRF